MTDHSYSSRASASHNFRKQPKQQRGKERVEKILEAAAAVFDEVGYEAATTHLIAAKAETAIGSLYQFFADKAAIFKAMEFLHTDRVKTFWAQMDIPVMAQLPLRAMIHHLIVNAAALFEQPVSRVVFIQFYLAPQIFQTIDDSMTQGAIDFMASILRQRNSELATEQSRLLAEVCVQGSNAIILAALRTPDLAHRQSLIQEIEDLLVSYLEPHVGDRDHDNVMEVMVCPHCQSSQLFKNGRRRGKQCYCCKSCGRQFVENPSR